MRWQQFQRTFGRQTLQRLTDELAQRRRANAFEHRIHRIQTVAQPGIFVRREHAVTGVHDLPAVLAGLAC